jgi:hypothetical protein
MNASKFRTYPYKYSTFRTFCLDLKRTIDKWGYKAEDYVTIYISKNTAEMLDRVCGKADEGGNHIFNIQIIVADQAEDFRAEIRFDFEPNDEEN